MACVAASAGKWRVFVIDDALPVDKEFNLIFSGAAEVHYLWAALLEKALAKSFGSYKELGKASPLTILQRVTGWMTETFRWAPLLVFAGSCAGVGARSDDGGRIQGNAIQERLKSNAMLFARGSMGKDMYLTRRNELLHECGMPERIVLVHRHQKDALFQRISKSLESGAVIGTSCRATYDHEDTGQVSRDHMFSVVAVKAVRGVGFIGIKSRWGKGSWNSFNALLHLSHEDGFKESRWAERHKSLHLEASLAMRRFLGIDLSVSIMQSRWHVISKALHFQKWRVMLQHDSSAFWVSIDQFVTVFNTLYTLSEVNRKYSLSTAKGRWMRKGLPGRELDQGDSVRMQESVVGVCTAGGRWPQSDMWLSNPKFQLTVLVNRTRVRIVLTVTKVGPSSSLEDTRNLPSVTFEKSEKQKAHSACLVGIVVVRESDLLEKGPNMDLSDFVLVSRPSDVKIKGSVSLREFELSRESSPFVIIPMMHEKNSEGSFRLDVYTSEQCCLRGREYTEVVAHSRQHLPSTPIEMLPELDSDWEESHQQDDATPQEALMKFDAAAWGSLVTEKVQLHPKLASVLYRDDIKDLAPAFQGKVFKWHTSESLPDGDVRGGIEGWEDVPLEGSSKAHVQGLLLRTGVVGLQRLSAVEQELMGLIEVGRRGNDYCINEHRVRINCADLEHGSRSIVARLAAFGTSGPLNIVGEICSCDPPFADSKLRNVRDLRGKVACIPAGGTSSMQEKVLRAAHAGVVAVIIINDTDEIYAIASDDSCALDKASNVMATLESRDFVKDIYKISLVGAAQTFSVSRNSLVLTEDVSIPVMMIGKKDGEALQKVTSLQLLPPSAGSLPQRKAAEDGGPRAKNTNAHVEWVRSTTQAERDAERRRLAEAEEKRLAVKAQQGSGAGQAGVDHKNMVGILSESSLLLRLKADLVLERHDSLRMNQIALNFVGLSAPQFKDTLETIYISLQFYHYDEIRDVPAAVEPVASSAGSSSGLYRMLSMDSRFRLQGNDGGVQIVFKLDPFTTGMEEDAKSQVLTSYLLSENLKISIWARNASCFFALGVATLPLFVLLRQQRESVLFHGSLPIREQKGSTIKGRTLLQVPDREEPLLHLRAANVGMRASKDASRESASALLKKESIPSLLPKSAVGRVEEPQALGITLQDHEVLSLARSGRFYTDEAALDRNNLPFAVEYFDTDAKAGQVNGEEAGDEVGGSFARKEGRSEETADGLHLEAQVRSIMGELAAILDNSQRGLPYPFPALKDLFKIDTALYRMLIQDKLWLAFGRYFHETEEAHVIV